MMWWVEGVKEIVNSSLSRKETLWLIYSHNQLITLLLSCVGVHSLVLRLISSYWCVCVQGVQARVWQTKPFQRESSKEIL